MIMTTSELRNKKERYFTAGLFDCCIRKEPGWIADVLTWFKLEYVSDTVYRAICKRVLELHASGAPLTDYKICECLQVPERQQCGAGPVEIGTLLQDAYLMGPHLQYLARDVYQEYRRMGASSEAAVVSDEITRAGDPTSSIEKLGNIPSKFAPPPDRRLEDNRWVFNELADELDGKRTVRQRMLGVVAIDNIVELPPNGMMTIAAETSCGKSVALLQAALYCITRYDKPAMFVSVEMTNKEVMRRASAWLSGKPFVRGQRKDGQRSPHVDSLNQLHRWQLDGKLQLFCGSTTAPNIARMLEAYLSRCPVGVVCVDYLQLIEPTNPRDNREQQVALISRSLKQMASKFSVPVITASQVNKEGLRLSSLRESNAIGNDSDVVILLDPIDRSKPTTNVKIMIAKNRHGATDSSGNLTIHWDKPLYKFRDCDEHDPIEQEADKLSDRRRGRTNNPRPTLGKDETPRRFTFGPDYDRAVEDEDECEDEHGDQPF